jgi:GxxExxY protein
MHQNEITGKIISAAIKVHSRLGPGLLESAYENCLSYLLIKEGLRVERQKPIPLIFEEVKLEAGYRIDLLVSKSIIVEIKSVDAINDIHSAQILTYMKLSGCKLGLLINFNNILLKDGIRRFILK